MGNLIDRLGGYSVVHAYHESLSDGTTACVIDNTIHSKESLGLLLLDYRQQHNIFEDNDYIVSLYDHEPSHLYTVKNITEEGYDYGNDWGWYRVLSNEGVGYNFRHATDEEIEAGRRL